MPTKNASSTPKTSAQAAMDNVFEGESTMAPGGRTTATVTPDGITYKNAIGLESTAEHQHVSVIWQRKCIPLDKFVEKVNAQDALKFDVTVQDDACRLTPDLHLVAPIKGLDGNEIANVPFTTRGLHSLASLTPMPRGAAEYLLAEHPDQVQRSETFAAYINRDLDLRNEAWMNPPADLKRARRGSGMAFNFTAKVRQDLLGANLPDNMQVSTETVKHGEKERQVTFATFTVSFDKLTSKDQAREYVQTTFGTAGKSMRGLTVEGQEDILAPRGHVLRLRNDVATNTPIIRTVVSEQYTTELTNAMMMQLIIEGLNNPDLSKILTSHLHDDGDNLIGNLLLPDYMQTVQDDSDYGIGVAFRNSEVKLYTLEIRPFAFRAICLNGCIWGRRDMKYAISKKHLGECDMEQLAKDVRRVLELALSHGQSFLNQILMTKEVAIADAPRVIAQIADERAITRDQVRNWVNGIRVETPDFGKLNANDLVNGLTRTAHESYDGNTRDELESKAGDLVSPSLDASINEVMQFWGKLSDRAENQTDKDIEYILEAIESKESEAVAV